MAEKFVDVFKKVIKKASGIETVNEELQKFMFIFRITPWMTTAIFLFSKKIRSVIDRLRLTEK